MAYTIIQDRYLEWIMKKIEPRVCILHFCSGGLFRTFDYLIAIHFCLPNLWKRSYIFAIVEVSLLDNEALLLTMRQTIIPADSLMFLPVISNASTFWPHLDIPLPVQLTICGTATVGFHFLDAPIMESRKRVNQSYFFNNWFQRSTTLIQTGDSQKYNTEMPKDS